MTLFPIKYSHAQLVEIAYKWVMKGQWGIAFKELRTHACNREFPDVIGFCSGHSVVVECKVTRGDFLSDNNKRVRKFPENGMGQWRYYCCPEGLIKIDELPEGWGLIYVSEAGKTRTAHKPMVEVVTDKYTTKLHYEFKFNIRAEHELMYSALRRLQLRGRIDEVYEKPWEKSDDNKIINTKEV